MAQILYKTFIIVLFSILIISCKKQSPSNLDKIIDKNNILIYYNKEIIKYKRNKEFFKNNIYLIKQFLKNNFINYKIYTGNIKDKNYSLIIIPDIQYIPDKDIKKLNELYKNGCKFFITGFSGFRDKNYIKIKKSKLYNLIKIEKLNKYINTTYSDNNLVYWKLNPKRKDIYLLNFFQFGFKYFYIPEFNKKEKFKTIYIFKDKKPAIIKKNNLIYSSINLLKQSNLNSKQIQYIILILLNEINIKTKKLNYKEFINTKITLPEIKNFKSYERNKNLKLLNKTISVSIGTFFPDFYIYTNTPSYITANKKIIKILPYKYYHINFKFLYNYFLINNKTKLKSNSILITTTTNKGYIKIIKLNTNNTYLTFAFRGNLFLYQRYKNSPFLYAVNKLDINLYLCGVVPAEMPFYFNKEALKSMAVVARTYTIKNLNRHINKGFNLCNTIHCQVYYGMDYESKNSNEAVFSTNKEVVKYKHILCDTPYHSTCGGITEDGKEVWGGDVKYLKSIIDTDKKIKIKSIDDLFMYNKKDFFCYLSPKFEWENKYSQKQLVKFFKNKLKNDNINNIIDIKVIKRSKSFHAKIIKIETNIGNFYISRHIQLAFPGGLNSTLIKIEKLPDKSFIVIGRGWGHSVGLCQWGAEGMAKRGYNYKQIIKHYYKGVEIENYENR